jgi:hypothetical protein
MTIPGKIESSKSFTAKDAKDAKEDKLQAFSL